MECVILGWAWQAERARLDIENVDERWRCTGVVTSEAAYDAVSGGGVDVLYLLREDASLLHALHGAAPVNPPWLVTDCALLTSHDARLPAENASALPALVRQKEEAHCLPVLTAPLIPGLTQTARRILESLEVPPRLRAWDFLPDMLALCGAHSALLDDLGRRLYPLVAMRHGLTPGCVERRLRVAVESTWNRAEMDALERFFGQSVDPARGKPTNKEFLCRLCEYVTDGYIPAPAPCVQEIM